MMAYGGLKLKDPLKMFIHFGGYGGCEKMYKAFIKFLESIIKNFKTSDLIKELSLSQRHFKYIK